MSQKLSSGALARDALRSQILKCASPQRPTSNATALRGQSPPIRAITQVSARSPPKHCARNNQSQEPAPPIRAITPLRAKSPPRAPSACARNNQGVVLNQVHNDRPTLNQGSSPTSSGDRLSQVNNELKELKAMYRKVVEAHRGLRTDFRGLEEQWQASECRADVAERELATLATHVNFVPPVPVIEPDSPELAKLREEAKCAHLETEGLWDAITENVEASALAALHKLDAEARIAAEPEFERQRRIALWEALGNAVDAATFAAVAQNVSGGAGPGRGPRPSLPVSVARRLFEASDGAKVCEGGSQGGSLGGSRRQSINSVSTPRQIEVETQVVSKAAAEGTVLRRVSLASTGASSAPPPLPSKCLVQRRASTGASAVTMCATPVLNRCRRESAPSNSVTRPEAPEMTPSRTFPGGVIVVSPQSSSVRDRIRALEGNGGK